MYKRQAPTGSGKSNVSLNLSFKLFEERNSLRKIYYVYPFNTLVEQNIKNLKKVFGENREVFNKIAVINSITPIKNEDKEIDDKNEDGRLDYYTKALLNRQFLNCLLYTSRIVYTMVKTFIPFALGQ